VAAYLVETPHPVEHAVEVLAGEQSPGTTVDTPGALAFEEECVSCDPDAVLGFSAVDAEVHLRASLFRDRASYKAERQARDLARERYLANDDVRSARRINRWWPPRGK
jgi:hypothetical protein